jgi:hypothetical protein
MTDSLPLLLYGLLDGSAADDPALEHRLEGGGVQGRPVECIATHGLAVLASAVGDREALRRPPTEDVLTFKSVVDAAFEEWTVLPLRYGVTVGSRAEVEEVLAPKAEEYRDTLRRLDGRAEMGLRLTLTASAAPDCGGPAAGDDVRFRSDRPGTAYLLARQREREQARRRRRRAVAPYREATADLTEDTVVEADAEGDAISMAALVARCNAAAFREAVAAVEGPSVVDEAEVIGPWAPFSFV